MGRPKHTKHMQSRKSSSGKAKATKKLAEVEYLYCGECISGLIVYPESVDDDDDSTDCNHVFEDNFKMFLRKQKDKNMNTSMQIRMKHEQRFSFAFLTKGNCICYDARYLGSVGERFYTDPERYADKWADDLLEGYEGAGPLIAHLKDLANDPCLKDLTFSQESSKTVNEDLVNAAHKWVVEQVDIALEEFKEFRDGLDENDRKKYDKLVEKQNDKWGDFECGDISFEEVDVIIKEIQKEMDDIIARHNNRNKDIDSLLELIEGKKLGAIPKKKKLEVPRSKKKNLNKKCKDTSQNSQNVSEKSEQLESEEFFIDVINVKPFENDDIRNVKPSKEKDIRNVKPSQKKYIKIVKPCEEKVIRNVDPSEVKASLSDNAKMTDEFMRTKETLNCMKAKLDETETRLKDEQLKNARLNTKLASMFQENDLLRSKILFNDFRKYRDVLRQRQNNNFNVIKLLRASPESAHTPLVQQALRSVHEFSARLILAEEQLSSQYATLCHELQTTNTYQELLFDMSSSEPPDLGSSCLNLLYRSVLMGQSSCAILPPPPTTRSVSSFAGSGASATSLRPVGSSSTSIPPAGSSASNAKARAGQVKYCASSRLERNGGSASVNLDDDSCSICFEEMNERNSFCLKLCRHRFHRVCMKQWLASPRGASSTCPKCRTYVHKDDRFKNVGAASKFQ